MDTSNRPPVDVVEREGASFEAVLALYRKNRRTLGFLPIGAFEQCADEGRLLAATVDGQVAGYAAYRVALRAAALVHLCVDETHRGKGVARALLDELLRDTCELDVVRLRCRREYHANELWPRYGFVCVGERPGRGKDRAPLLVWKRSRVDDAPLLSRLQEDEVGEKWKVVVDANVFLDFEAEGEHGAESKSLLADWLADEIAVHVTAELANEIVRHADPAVRARHRSEIASYPMLRATPDEHRRLVDAIDQVLPEARTESDGSDRRQLAHAVGGGADFFVTRDEVLLRFADAIQHAFRVTVLRPTDLIRRIHTDYDPVSYAPTRVAGTQIRERAPRSESEILPFQRFARGESKAEYLAVCRRLLADPTGIRTRVISSADGDPIMLYALDEQPSDGARQVVLLRALNHPLAPTLVRRVIADLIVLESDAVSAVRCSDTGDPVVDQCLDDLGFTRDEAGYLKRIYRGLLPLQDVHALVPESTTWNIQAVERRLWPLKVEGPDAPATYIVPIRPNWAKSLFDTELASLDLFGAEHAVALALENAFYSGSPVQLPEGSRILWYVSGKEHERVAQVRACSLVLESVRDRARSVFRRFRRLGVYTWRDVRRTVDGPDELVTAYRFAFTERLASPVSWDRLQGLLREVQGHGNPIAGPTKVSNDVFVRLYREATS